jgi:Uma2 family endonuclease
MTLAPSPSASRRRAVDDSREHVLLYPVSWLTYVELNEHNGRPALKMTYTDERLEIMAPRRDHSVISRFLDQMVTITSDEFGIPAVSYRDATWKREDMEKGLEADDCFYIQHAELADQKGVDMSIPQNPPPDLAIETDITHGSLDKEAVYAAIGIPELWRWDNGILRIRLLDESGQYLDSHTSRALPMLTAATLQEWVQRRLREGEWKARSAFREWARQQQASPTSE